MRGSMNLSRVVMEESQPATRSDNYSGIAPARLPTTFATVDKYREEAGSLQSLQSFRVADQRVAGTMLNCRVSHTPNKFNILAVISGGPISQLGFLLLHHARSQTSPCR
jgi:hypothetical protein